MIGGVWQKDVGANHYAKLYNNADIDGSMYQASIKAKYNDIYIEALKSRTLNNDDSVLNGTIISPFSNDIGWIKGVQTAHSFISNTTSSSIMIGGLFKPYSIPLFALVGYNRYDIIKNYLDGTDIKTMESFLHTDVYLSSQISLTLRYSHGKNLDLSVKENKNTRLFINYNF